MVRKVTCGYGFLTESYLKISFLVLMTLALGVAYLLIVYATILFTRFCLKPRIKARDGQTAKEDVEAGPRSEGENVGSVRIPGKKNSEPPNLIKVTQFEVPMPQKVKYVRMADSGIEPETTDSSIGSWGSGLSLFERRRQRRRQLFGKDIKPLAPLVIPPPNIDIFEPEIETARPVQAPVRFYIGDEISPQIFRGYINPNYDYLNYVKRNAKRPRLDPSFGNVETKMFKSNSMAFENYVRVDYANPFSLNSDETSLMGEPPGYLGVTPPKPAKSSNLGTNRPSKLLIFMQFQFSGPPNPLNY